MIQVATIDNKRSFEKVRQPRQQIDQDAMYLRLRDRKECSELTHRKVCAKAGAGDDQTAGERRGPGASPWTLRSQSSRRGLELRFRQTCDGVQVIVDEETHDETVRPSSYD